MLSRLSFLRALALAAGLASTAAAQSSARRPASGPVLPPAPFAQPEVGAVFQYDGFSNRILGGKGLVTRFVDDLNRDGSRFGIFFVDNANAPLVYSKDALTALFPLSNGKRVRFVGTRGDLQWLYEARVVGTERATTPAGSFDTWVVETIEAPKRTAAPTTAVTIVSTFWYAPSVKNIVRLMTISTNPSGEKQLRRVELRSITRPNAEP